MDGMYKAIIFMALVLALMLAVYYLTRLVVRPFFNRWADKQIDELNSQALSVTEVEREKRLNDARNSKR
jgi:type II secretory pathway component PulM